MHSRIHATTIALRRALVAAALVPAIPVTAFAQCESFDAETTAFGLTPTVIPR